jgi:hypothetical protein
MVLSSGVAPFFSYISEGGRQETVSSVLSHVFALVVDRRSTCVLARHSYSYPTKPRLRIHVAVLLRAVPKCTLYFYDSGESVTYFILRYNNL